ncbi:LCP family protein [Actinomadura madurae]|uniref:LCP family protein n=1 Tax=Actinomadura madurae TaxID=1993 RepID=UPI002025E408|nr:LCP family protein [Actinomadura madurae]URM95732.1 LCP family protein [Actinomadura madurae]
MSDNAPRRDDLAGETAAHTTPAAPDDPAGHAVEDDGEAVGSTGEDSDAANVSQDVAPAHAADGDGEAAGSAERPAGEGAEASDEDEADGEEPGEGPAGGGGRKRRRRVWRWVAVGAVAVLLVGGGGAAWLYHDLVGGIDQERVDDRLGANRPEKLNKSLNILLIGSDTREGENSEYAVPGMAGARSDTTILLHLSPNRDQAVGISFPRDSMVKIPACKKEKGGTVPAQFGMLNAAFAFAGPTCTWKTLESLTGIHIDHFVQVDFAGFKRMVDALGGVEICVDKPVNDPRAELHLPAGKQTVKGDEALGYVRARYSLGDGSDLERIERQQKFMAAVVDKATSGSVLTDPAKTYKFLKAATKSMTTDDDLDLAGMRKLADGLKGMSAGQVRFVTVPVEGYAPDPNRVQWNEALAKPLFEAIRHDDELPAAPASPGPAKPAPPAPGKVNVTVVDAGARDARVERVVKQLRQRGYKVAKKVEKAADAPESRLVYAPPAEAQASALARDVPNAMLTADPAGPRDGVRLVIGENGVRLAPPAINRIGGGVKAGKKPCD